MFSPIVIGNQVYYDDTLIGHRELMIKKVPLTLNENNRLLRVWTPEWRWTERYREPRILAWDAHGIMPAWLSLSTFDELDQIVNDKFNHWQKLYEAFRRTDNILDNYTLKIDLLLKATKILTCNPSFELECSTNNRESIINNWWDTYYKVWKNPDNRIPVWRD